MFILFSVMASAPTCYIAAKDSYFSLRRIKQPTCKDNIRVSVIYVLTTLLLSATIPNISDAITLTGATINPFIGFIFPILFYLKLSKQSMRSPKKLFAVFVTVLILFASVLGFI